MKKHLLLLLSLSLVVHPVYAQMTDEDCDPDVADCRDEGEGQIKDPVKSIYPYKPFETSYIKERLSYLTESDNFLWNVREMENRGLNRGRTKSQPWGGSFWPLNQGQIANPYQEKEYSTALMIFNPLDLLSWKHNVNDFKKNRKVKIHPRAYELSEEELAKLAPSEKYDLLLGDTSFDLTNRIWNYAEKWGNEKRWGFLTMINLPEGYRAPTANKLMALWEGICHGWAVAAGHSPRPEKTVWVRLPNGKRMPFYPNDIKALVSLMWANSTIQSNVLVEGNRCNKKRPDRDKHGRYIDTEIDRDDTELQPRCADVHPGIFHTATVNILGIEKRSFVVDINPKAPITNQPVSGYDLVYYNPKTGKDGPLHKSIISVEEYGKKDPFSEYRNPETTHIVGVDMKLYYIDWEYPKKKVTNSPSDDKVKDFSFQYDLELDKNGNVIGGQWRVKRKGGQGIFGGSTNQPDFFWVVPKDWKNYFAPVEGLPEWDFKKSTVPPHEYLTAAHTAHGFVYEESEYFFGVNPKCPAFPEGEGPMIKVDCAFRYPQPQPLIQVVDQLLQQSSRR